MEDNNSTGNEIIDGIIGGLNEVDFGKGFEELNGKFSSNVEEGYVEITHPSREINIRIPIDISTVEDLNTYLHIHGSSSGVTGIQQNNDLDAYLYASYIRPGSNNIVVAAGSGGKAEKLSEALCTILNNKFETNNYTISSWSAGGDNAAKVGAFIAENSAENQTSNAYFLEYKNNGNDLSKIEFTDTQIAALNKQGGTIIFFEDAYTKNSEGDKTWQDIGNYEKLAEKLPECNVIVVENSNFKGENGHYGVADETLRSDALNDLSNYLFSSENNGLSALKYDSDSKTWTQIDSKEELDDVLGNNNKAINPSGKTESSNSNDNGDDSSSYKKQRGAEHDTSAYWTNYRETESNEKSTDNTGDSSLDSNLSNEKNENNNSVSNEGSGGSSGGGSDGGSGGYYGGGNEFVFDSEGFKNLGNSLMVLSDIHLNYIYRGIDCLDDAANLSDSYSNDLKEIGEFQCSFKGSNVVDGIKSQIDFYFLTAYTNASRLEEDQWLGSVINADGYLERISLADISKKTAVFTSTDDVLSYIKERIDSGDIPSVSLPFYVNQFIVNGVINGGNMHDIICPLVFENKIDASTLFNINVTCMKTLVMQGISEDGNSYSKYYSEIDKLYSFNKLRDAITTHFIDEYNAYCESNNLNNTNDARKKYIAERISECYNGKYSTVDDYLNDFFRDYSKALTTNLIDSNLMYSRYSIPTSAYATIGLYTSLGYRLPYEAKSFESLYDGSNPLGIGINFNGVDCNNSFDFLVRCCGINATAYAAKDKYNYAFSIEDYLSREDSIRELKNKNEDVNVSSVFDMMRNNGIINSYAEESEGFKSGQVGDIVVCETGMHMVTIVENTGKGYVVAESTGRQDRGIGLGFQLNYYSYDAIAKLGNNYTSQPENAYVVDMSNLYNNTSCIFKEDDRVIYTTDGDNYYTNEPYTYEDYKNAFATPDGQQGNCNNFISVEAYATEFDLDQDRIDNLKIQYDNANQNTHAQNYKTKDSY